MSDTKIHEDENNPSPEDDNKETIQDITADTEKKKDGPPDDSILNIKIDDTESVLTETQALSVEGSQPAEVTEPVPEETKPEEESFETRLKMLSQFSSDYFLNKQSPSFKCFEQALCSRSDLLLTLNFFPPLTDPGIDAAFNYIRNKKYFLTSTEDVF